MTAQPNAETRKCRWCAEEIKPDALICRFCQRAQTEPVQVQDTKQPWEARQFKTVAEYLNALDPNELAIVNAERSRRSKSILAAYLLWLFLGGIGAHRFYTGGVAWGILYIAMLACGFFSMFISWIMLGACLFFDLFMIPAYVRGSDERAIVEASKAIGKPLRIR
jgi:TM2 domain-containing membrane protein YozV